MRKRLTALFMALFLCVLPLMPAAALVNMRAAASETSSSDAGKKVSGSDKAADRVSGSDASPSDVSGSDVSGTDKKPQRTDVQQPMRDMTASDIASEINIGWCLGESLDSWESSAGYDSFYNSNAYQMAIRYDDAKGYRSMSIANTFKNDNTCTFTWQTGLIESEALEDVGDIGFEIWNLAFEEDTTIRVKCTEAHLIRRNKQAVDFEDLLGEHEVTISRFGTGAVLTSNFPSPIEHTTGITDGTFKVTVELIDFPQKEYSKEQFFETLWNNPLTTKDMITAVKARGFNAVRVPITFFNHTLKDTYVVDAGWLNRIQEVVDYVVSQDMYCIIDMHNDGSTSGWLRVNPTTSGSDTSTSSEEVRKRFEAIWRQVAEKFKNYDEHLLFQDCNEPTNTASSWDYPGEADINWMNDLNQLFVNTVRSTGSNNEKRCLLVAPYSGSYEASVINGFKLPSDSAENRLMAAVNCFYPADFSWKLDSGSDTSYTDVIDWGTPEDTAKMDELFSSMKSTFTDNNIPLCIVAFGTDDKGNTDARVNHARYFVSKAVEYNIPCFWWDDGSLLMRRDGSWSCEELAEVLVDSTSIHVDNVDVDITGKCWYTGGPVTPEVSLTLSGYDIGGGPTVQKNENGESITIEDDRSLTERMKLYGIPDYDKKSKKVNTLKENEDYTVAYEHNVDIGTARLIITGKGKFSGMRTVEFNIREEPSAIMNVLSFGSDNPDVPLVVMLSIPMLMILGGLAIYNTIQRRERERVEAVIAASLNESGVSPDTGYDGASPEETPRRSSRSEAPPPPRPAQAPARQDISDGFDDFDDLDSDPPRGYSEPPRGRNSEPLRGGYNISGGFDASDGFDDDF